MKVICAGLPKTGTKSVASALRILGYNVHDTEEHWIHHLDEYVDAMEGRQMPDFAKMYAYVDAVTDSPACFFWEEMASAFLGAKVLLMVRDSEEVWLESLEKTALIFNSINSSLWFRLRCFCTPTGRKFRKLTGDIATTKLVIPGRPRSDVYTEHNAKVKSTIRPDQLLVYNVKQGWEPLCEFLGVEVPDIPFPRLNTKSDLVRPIIVTSQIQQRITTELFLVVGSMVLLGAVLFFIFV